MGQSSQATSSRGMDRRELSIVILLGLLAAWLWTTKLVIPALTGPLIDYIKHYESAYLILADITPYRVIMYYYPVFLALLHQPLFWFEESESVLVWSFGNIILVMMGTLVLADMLATTSPPADCTGRLKRMRSFILRHPLVCTLVVVGAFEPLQRVLRSGNVDPLNFLFASLLLGLLVTRRDWRGGVILGLFCLVKVMPILLLPPLVALKRWRVVGAMGAVLAAYGVLTLSFGWWRGELYLFREILPNAPWVWQHISLSVHRLAGTLLVPSVLEESATYARLILGINVVLGLGYCALLVAAMRRGFRHPDLLLAAGLICILLYSPLLETIHFSWILPAFAVQARAWLGGRLGDGMFALLVMGWMGLTASDTISTLLPVGAIGGQYWMVQTLLYLFLLGLSLWAALSGGQDSDEAANRVEPEGLAP